MVDFLLTFLRTFAFCYNFREKCLLSFPPNATPCKIIFKREELGTHRNEMHCYMIFFYKVTSQSNYSQFFIVVGTIMLFTVGIIYRNVYNNTL